MIHKFDFYECNQGRAKLHFLMPKSNQTIVKDFNFLQTIQIICKSDKIQVDNIKQ